MSLQDIHDLYSVPHIKSLEIKVSDGSTLGNPDLVVEKAELTDSLSSASELMFGSCEAACFKLQVATADKEYKNLWLDVWATVQENSGDLMIDNEHYLLMSDGSKMRMNPYLHSGQIGRFKVVLDEPVADRSWRNLTCYDAMYDILRAEVSEWYSGLTFPMTVKALRDSFFSFLGIEQEETTLIHDSLIVQGNFVATSKLSGRTIIKAICELGGVFGHINPEGKFVYLSIPSEESVTYSYYRDGTGMYERDVVEPITGIIARDAEDDVGTSVGTMDNPYIITGNPLVFGIEGTPELEDVLNTLLTKISAVTYRPFSVTSYGNPFLPVGTSVVVNTKNITINSLIMTKRLTGIQALKDTISAKGQKERLNDTIDLSSELYQTDGRYHLLRNDVNGLESEVYDEHGNSVISQMANEVVLKVDSSGKIVNVELTAEASGSAFKVVADNIDFISDGKIQLTSKSLEINSTNFSVTSAGSITAKSGTIGGWSITTNALYNGMTSLSDTTHDGVWIGQDGIALGKGGFKVTKAGELTCTNATISRSGYVGTTISTFFLNEFQLSFSQDFSSTKYSATYAQNYADLKYQDSVSTYYLKLTPQGLTAQYNSGTTRNIITNSSGSIDIGKSGTQQTTPIRSIYSQSLTVYGTKSRGAETKDYGTKLLYCYETPTPMFGDVGEGKIAEDGKCYIWTDAEFSQTIADGAYQVFLQKYGQGECYVTERKSNYFVVEGTAGLSFGWEIKARQAGFENLRLESEREEPEIFKYNFGSFELKESDYGEIALEHMKSISDEREVA